MIRKYSEIFCWKNVSSFCSAKATHIFSAKNIRILCIESAKTVNEMTLNELVKLKTLWTTGPWSFLDKIRCSCLSLGLCCLLRLVCPKLAGSLRKNLADDILCNFPYFSLKTGFDISCKLSLKGSKFFPFRADPFSEGSKNNFVPLKVYTDSR